MGEPMRERAAVQGQPFALVYAYAANTHHFEWVTAQTGVKVQSSREHFVCDYEVPAEATHL